VLLQVVADARDVGGDLDPAGQPDTGDLTQSRVRLLGRRCVDTGADTAALRGALQRGRLGLGHLVLAAHSEQLLDCGHRFSVFLRRTGPGLRDRVNADGPRSVLYARVTPGISRPRIALIFSVLKRLTCWFPSFSDPRGRACRAVRSPVLIPYGIPQAGGFRSRVAPDGRLSPICAHACEPT
jgi:hypothetical protein